MATATTVWHHIDAVSSGEDEEEFEPIAMPEQRVYDSHDALEKDFFAWTLQAGFETAKQGGNGKNRYGQQYRIYHACAKGISSKQLGKSKGRTPGVRLRGRGTKKTACPFVATFVALDSLNVAGWWKLVHNGWPHNHRGVAIDELANHKRRARREAAGQLTSSSQTHISNTLPFPSAASTDDVGPPQPSALPPSHPPRHHPPAGLPQIPPPLAIRPPADPVHGEVTTTSWSWTTRVWEHVYASGVKVVGPTNG